MHRCYMAVFITACSIVSPAFSETKQQYLWDALQKSGEEGIQLAPGVDVGIALEIDAAYEKKGDEDTSSLNVSTFEIGIDAKLLEGVKGTASLFWEQGSDPIEVDTAYIVLGGTEKIPVALTAGRLYVPFGSFESSMVSDPLTLELGETRETAAGLGYENNWLNLWAGAFAGELNNADSIGKGVASAQITVAERFTFGGAFLSDIGEAGYLDDINELLDAGGSYKRAGAWNAYALLDVDPFTLHAEYVGAAESMELTDAEGGVTEMTPKTWSVDAGYTLTEDWSLAARYEGSDQFKPDEMPEHQYGATVAYALNTFTTLAAEYLYGTFEPEDADARHLATARLALAF